MRLGSWAVFCSAALSACAGSAKAPRPGAVTPVEVPDTATSVRGTAEAAGLLTNEDQLEITSRMLRNFYYPGDRQASWLDPRPLSHVRSQVADDTVGADPDFADEVVRAARSSRICVLNYRDFGCRGKSGAVLRFSWPYSASKDSAIVYVTFSPRDSAGKVSPPQTETRFSVRRGNDGYWDMSKGTTVYSRPKTDSTNKSKP